MERTAVFDPTRRYRYRLGRRWAARGPRAVFVLLNPSAADEVRDDPTLRRCIGFARTWRCAALDVVNLFAWRTRRPAALRAVEDPVGAENDRHILDAVRRADVVLAGWGNAGALHGRDARVLDLLAAQGPVSCLGRTARGQPRHPLYVRGVTRRRRLRRTP